MDRSGRAPALHEQLRRCAGLLRRVRQGGSLTDALAEVPPEWRPGCQAIGFHVMRWRAAAEAARRELAPRNPPADVDALLTCALSLLWPPAGAAYAPHVVVDETVRAARQMARGREGFVNAVLRHFLRRAQELVPQLLQHDEVRLHHPAWWIGKMRQDWPDHAEAVMHAAQKAPPMTLRAHAGAGGLDALRPALDDAGLAGHRAQVASAAQVADALGRPWIEGPRPAHTLPQGWTLQRPAPVQDIPGFTQGLWSVQDAAAQWAAPLLLRGLRPAQGPRLRLLDACSAPGGKSAALLEHTEADLLCLDADAQRLQRVQENLARIGLQAVLRAADARQPSQWWDGHPFDGILLDAPCSGSGIVRRHPDARWLRRPSDIPVLARVQAELLDALWPLLRPGGHLLYATCSVFREEGCGQIAAFLQRHGLPTSVIDPGSPGHLLPLVDNPPKGESAGSAASCDGFFYALLRKP